MLAASLPKFYELHTSTITDLEWNAQQRTAAWNHRDLSTTQRLLESQLVAVQRELTTTSNTTPDTRILRYLIGVCASFMGHFATDKKVFGGVFEHVYHNRRRLDDGDIAAARWLGDACLQLREDHNALLAYSMSFSALISRYVAIRGRTVRVTNEIRLVDHWLHAFKRIRQSLSLNIDPTDIFFQTSAVQKDNLLTHIEAQLYATNSVDQNSVLAHSSLLVMPSCEVGSRPQIDLVISKGLLLCPSISPHD